MKSNFAILLVATGFISGAAMAQAQSAAVTKPASAKPGTAAKTPKTTNTAQAPRTAKSLDCSKQADAKSFHGKSRKAFMSSCKKT